MFYCFVLEDITSIAESDPLSLQANYAELLGKCIYCNIKEKKICNKNNEVVSLDGEEVFLRCSYDIYKDAAQIVSDNSGKLKESLEDIEKIENWFSYVLTERVIKSEDLNDIYTDTLITEIKTIFEEPKRVFLKSAQKGFSVSVPFEMLLKKDADFFSFLKKKCSECGCNKLLLANYYDVKKDSYGKNEVRFIVLDGEIINSSRNLHSLKHRVTKKMTEKAKLITEEIAKIQDFPCNYILDIAEFINDGNSFIDVVELNPITTSMCYVNNSVFKTCAEEISFVHPKLGMGYEYCYDFLCNADRYVLERYVGENYEYTSDEHWEF